ncbi:MAG TPA: cation diffusion facilitator family transporter [Acidobacteriota bacterium]
MSDSDAANKKTLRLALALTSGAMLVEAAGGYLSNSLALLADAAHMLVDAAALGFTLYAFRRSGRRRGPVIAASLCGLALWAAAGVIILVAFRRFPSPPPIRSGLMLAVALFGLLVNIGVAAMLHHRRTKSLRIRGSVLHVLADGLASVGVIAAAVAIRAAGALVWDPAASLVVCLLILWSSGRLVLESFRYPHQETVPRNPGRA